MLTSDDYPEEALNRGAMGTAIARVEVDATGRVTGCTVVATSRSEVLDQATCRAAMERGKFSPAIAADGKPTAAQRMVKAEFQIRE